MPRRRQPPRPATPEATAAPVPTSTPVGAPTPTATALPEPTASPPETPVVIDGRIAIEAEGQRRPGAGLPGGFVVADSVSGASQDRYIASVASGDTFEVEFPVPTVDVVNWTVSVRARSQSDAAPVAMWVESRGKRTRWDVPAGDWVEVDLIAAAFPEGAQSVVIEATGGGLLIDSVGLFNSGGRPQIDLNRRDRIRALGEAFDMLAVRTGSHLVRAGSNNSGTGAVYLSDTGDYGPVSIADALIAAIDDPTADEQEWLDKINGPLPNGDETEIVAVRCAGRVGLFSKSAGLAPKAGDSRWWVDNDCPLEPIEGNPSYFELTNPVGGVDALRVAAASAIIEGFQRLYEATGNVRVTGGFGERGSGPVYINSLVNEAFGDLSVAQALQKALDDEGIDYQVPLIHPPELSSGEISSAYCTGPDGVERVAVFTFSEGIEPSAEDRAYWIDNGCPNGNLDGGRDYYVVNDG